jgi:hypothetical protein
MPNPSELERQDDPRVARLLAAGWRQIDYWGMRGAWQSPDRTITVQKIEDAIGWLNRQEQAKPQMGEQ